MTDINLKPPFAMILGDTHGSVYYVVQSIREAAERGVTRIIQLGDWGYLWPDTNLDDPTEEINVVSQELLDANITMYFIRGNHDWKAGIEANRELLGRMGFCYLDDARQYLGFEVPTYCYGGAVSIDRKYRKEGVDYFKDEMPTPHYDDRWDEGWGGIMFAHDSVINPPGFEKPHPLMLENPDTITDSATSRDRVGQACIAARVSALFHGHYHTSQNYQIGDLKVYALNAAGNIGDSLYLDINGEVTV